MKSLNKFKPELYLNDLPADLLRIALKKKIVAWDIETSGLDWRSDKIATCQLCVPDEYIAIVKIGEKIPTALGLLLVNSDVQKVFHHAMFDLRFMSHKWELKPVNIACTKIAAKLLSPTDKNAQKLQPLLKQYLDIRIEKKERLSNWFSDHLTESQIAYAAEDVMYLIPLIQKMDGRLQSEGLKEIKQACFQFIPTRVILDIKGYGYIFDY